MIQSFVAFSFLAWVISLLGLGCFAGEFIKKYFKDFEVASEIRLLYYGTFGLMIISVVGAFFNFFIPLNAFFSTIILTIGLLLFFVYRKNILASYHWHDWLCLAILFFYSYFYSLMKLIAFDTGLYHLPMVNWISNYALPFGLANLHGRFGFNSFWLIDAAIVSPLRLITESPFFIINTILLFFYGSFIFLTLLKMIRENKMVFSSVFAITTFIPWFYCLTNLISSPSPDVPTMLLTLFVTFLLIRAFETKKADYFFISLIFSFYIVTIKLSAIPYFAVVALILLLALIFKNYLKRKSGLFAEKLNILKYIVTGLVLLIMAIPYFIRGIISSGYLAYPSTLGNFNLKWSVPLASAISEADWVKSWARETKVIPAKVLSDWNWMGVWTKNMLADERLWIGFTILGIALLLFIFIAKKKKSSDVFFAVSLISLLGCAFWFFVAPDPRFGYGYLYSFSGILWGFGMYNILVDKKYAGTVLKFVLGIFIILFVFQNNLNFRQVNKTKKFKNVDLVENKTNDSVSIFTPKRGEQCFDTTLMCAPIFNKELKVVFDKNNNPKMFWIEK